MNRINRYPEIEEARRRANDIGISFFIHLTLISGGTLVLLVPYVQSLKIIQAKSLFLLGGISLILSIISSVSGLYLMRKLAEHLPLSIALEKNKFERFTTLKEYLGRFALSTYIIGIIFMSVFVYSNLL